MDSMLFPVPAGSVKGEPPKISEKDVTHSGGRGETFHDWFPYLEGFSSQFVKDILDSRFSSSGSILEPFGGVGTTPLSLAQLGIATGYCEVNPFLCELIELKSKCLSLTQNSRGDIVTALNELVLSIGGRWDQLILDDELSKAYKAVFGTSAYFPDTNYLRILALKSIENSLSEPLIRSFLRMAVATTLLPASNLRRAGDVRFKTEKELLVPTPNIIDLVIAKLKLFASDITSIRAQDFGSINLVCQNARELQGKQSAAFDGVITSPPYLNGTNYIRNTKLELWYLGYLTAKADLRSLRTEVVTSAINDVESHTGTRVIPEAKAIVDQITANCYDSRIPKMIAGYFEHMKEVAAGIYDSIKVGSPVCVDIGDSVYGGIHVATHEILRDVFIGERLVFEDEIVLRTRFSNKGHRLSQRLLIFRKLK